MPRQVKSSEDELFALCDEIQAIDGKVTAARLREAAGGGGHTRLKAVVEAWQERRDEAAKPTEDSVPEKTGRGRRQAGKSQGRGRNPDQDVKVPAKGGSSRRGNKDAAESITLEDAEQTEIAMEAGGVKAALSGGEATKTETPGEPDVPSSIEQAEAEVTEALDTIARQESEDGPALETEAVSFTASSRQKEQRTLQYHQPRPHQAPCRQPQVLMPRSPASRPMLRISGARMACCGTRSGMSGRPGSGKSNFSTA